MNVSKIVIRARLIISIIAAAVCGLFVVGLPTLSSACNQRVAENPLTNQPIKRILILAAALSMVVMCSANSAFGSEFSAENGAIVRTNGGLYYNRPLYGNHMPAIVLAGDRPQVRFFRDPYTFGHFMIAFDRSGTSKWLKDFSKNKASYNPGRMTWEISDVTYPNVAIRLQTVPMADASGYCVRFTAKGLRNGDKLIWAYGGATTRVNPDENLSSRLDPILCSEAVSRGFVADDCIGNSVSISGDIFKVTPPLSGSTANTIAGRCSVPSTIVVADAQSWEDPKQLSANAGGAKPILCGITSVSGSNAEVIWAVQAYDGDVIGDTSRLMTPEKSFKDGIQRTNTISRQVVVKTPDDRLNAGVGAACAAIDGTYYPPVFVHGAMAWNIPFPGWRTIYGPTVLGWHDNVKAEAKHYIDSQVTSSEKNAPHADPKLGYGQEAADSRFWGSGRIMQNSGCYNFQSLFFDQIMHAWRWTADPQLEKLLRPALNLQLEWARDCFDPDGDGLYESYINTWPTDSVWFNGGGTAEESCYAYRGEIAAAEMARRAGDSASEQAHRSLADKIRVALLERLWINGKGYVGAYIEQGGHKRLHTDSWLYSIFLPIDAGILSKQQSAQALYYTEWGLERVKMPFGGERCWTSNWIPSMWSTRELYPGDNYHLALAYYQTGLPDEGWKLLSGNFLESMYYNMTPGGLTCSNGGTDFTDVSSIFCRTIVEGLFGYKPDYPNGAVKIAPQFPSKWDKASITTPDFSLTFTRSAGVDSYQVKLTKEAQIELHLPLRAKSVSGVELNGRPAKWKVQPGFGMSIITMQVPKSKTAQITIRWSNPIPQGADVYAEVTIGSRVILASPQGPITKVVDPDSVLTKTTVKGGKVAAGLSGNTGNHLVFALVSAGKFEQWQLFKIKVSNPAAEAAVAAKVNVPIPADAQWQCTDISPILNGDVTTIYQQQYLSPRPKTCSVRIGVDGYSAWTFYYWNQKPPVIDISNVSGLLSSNNTLVTPQHVPFAWTKGKNNIAFTSLWDNWPASAKLPVGKQGDAVWFLVCGSTNPMQTKIANAELRMEYADGVVEKLELVPPINFWNLSTILGNDYNYTRDSFCLPKTPPQTVQLGNNCRAMLLNHKLRPGVVLKNVTLECLSQDVVIGLMGVTVMHTSAN